MKIHNQTLINVWTEVQNVCNRRMDDKMNHYLKWRIREYILRIELISYINSCLDEDERTR